MSKHSAESLLSRHPAISREYADSTARTGASGFVAADVGLLAWQKDDDSVWLLVATTPTWVRVNYSGTISNIDNISVRIKKATSGTISRGQVCRIAGFETGTDTTLVELANASSGATMAGFCIADGSITDSQEGEGIVMGHFHSYDTSSWSNGDRLWVGTTDGALTNTRPSGAALVQHMCQVLYSDSSVGTLSVLASPVLDLPNIAPNSLWQGGATGIAEQIAISDLFDEQMTLSSYIYGMGCIWTSASTYIITPGVCRNDDDDGFIRTTSNLSVNIASSGAGGLDTGSEASSTWYYVFVIYNPTSDTAASLLSTSKTSPTLPSGYTKKRLVGCIRNDASSDLHRILQHGQGHLRFCFYWDGSKQTMSGGAETSWTDLSLSDYVSPLSGIVIARMQSTGNGWFYLRPNGATGTESMKINNDEGICVMVTDSSQVVEYYVDGNTTAGLSIQSYFEVL